MIKIENILTPERSKSQIEGISKKRSLETLAQIFADNIEGFDVVDIYQHFINREKLGTTGIGGGIAIPHCCFNTNGETYCACMTLSSPIDFDSVDSEPVDIIFAMLVPENAEQSHLEILATLAAALQKPQYVSKLRQADTNAALYAAATGD